ncbi:MAG TPA: iron ABC transporter permease [Candidatus Binatia bacterium]|nr:iron ABC transporter permease [Candidatus Binatia bacterium]
MSARAEPEAASLRSGAGGALALHATGASLLAVTMLAALAIGPVALDPIAAWRAASDDPAHIILVGARAPRILLAALVGGALGVGGASLQALLRNPLACPHVLGISGGAALLGIVAMIATPLASASALLGGQAALMLVPAAAFAGGLVTAALVQEVAAATGRVSPYTLLLTGVVFNAFAAAVITFINTLADFYRSSGILSWVVGTVTVRGGAWTVVAAATLAAGLVLLLASARDLNALALGDEGAASLGVDVDRTRRHVYLAVALLVAGAVPVSGMIGFVGLIVPHVVRLAVGSDQRRVLPGSLWGGAVFLVAADTVARSVLGATELPVGVITALSGGPFFLYLLRRQGRRALAGEA